MSENNAPFGLKKIILQHVYPWFKTFQFDEFNEEKAEALETIHKALGQLDELDEEDEIKIESFSDDYFEELFKDEL